jgi:hypothetical protein
LLVPGAGTFSLKPVSSGVRRSPGVVRDEYHPSIYYHRIYKGGAKTSLHQ